MTQVAGYYYDSTEPMPQQQVDYDCSAASTAWFGRSIGWGWTELNVLFEFSKAGLISPAWGLLDGTGAGIVSWLALQPLRAVNGHIDWQDLQSLAGAGPVIMGGAAWYHWVGVRQLLNDQVVSLANSARGYDGIYDTLTAADFGRLGPFNAVWLVP
jgi:hypothetical protein